MRGRTTGPAAPPKRDLILVVDDDQIIRLLVTRILDQAGYRSLAVESPLEALSVLETQEPRVSLVITDIVMPGESGIAFGERIRERWPDLPVLYMSGYSPEMLESRGVVVPERFIPKPFTIERLLEVLARVLAPSPLERRRGAGVPRGVPPRERRARRNARRQ